MMPTISKASIAALCLTVAILALPAYAVTNELVGSAESHSIEKFDSSGTWTKTFASTGPWVPVSIAASPTTHDVFVSTYTQTILRYHSSGTPFGPAGSYWSTFNLNDPAGNPTGSLLFDSHGNLYVATNYGTSGYVVKIYKFPASQLVTSLPVATGSPIITTLGRGDQMAWDNFGNLCIGSFDEDVQCYNASTGALTFDYVSEIQYLGIQPAGIAFGPKNNLTVSSLFTGQIWTEAVEQTGPMTLLATGTVQPAEVGWLAVDSGGMLYLPEWHNANARYGSCTSPLYACVDYDFSSDVVYKIDPSTGTVISFITTHLWGPYQMIFVSF